jgi:predicted nucleic acid-binding Zn ribbon protein
MELLRPFPVKENNPDFFMATYVYETIPARPGQKPKQFEIRQSMKEAALTKHPETGEPIRRVITGGFGLMGVGKSPVSVPHQHSGGCCGGGCGLN